jgi:hypothetical protein
VAGRMKPVTVAAALREYELAVTQGITPEERRLIAGRRWAAMSPAQRAAVAERNQMLLDSAALKLNASAIAVNGPGARLLSREGETRSALSVPSRCPRCQIEARGHSDAERVDFLTGHFNAKHGGH